MKLQETREIKEKSIFLQKHSVSIRIWHWLTFIIISFLIITVLFNSTMFDNRGNTAMVKNVLNGKNIVVSDDQARAVAHEYGDKLWVLHKYLGFGLTFLLLSRIVIEITLSEEEKTSAKIKNALLLYRKNIRKSEFKHYLIVKYSYTLFYLLIIYMATTGLLLAFESELGIPRQTNHFIKDIHGFGQYLMYTFICIHLVGVINADMTDSKGIISGMVNGGE
jgi:Ni/Fe-hydrogenase 1 B-type cytochrome subunit